MEEHQLIERGFKKSLHSDTYVKYRESGLLFIYITNGTVWLGENTPLPNIDNLEKLDLFLDLVGMKDGK